MDKRHWFAGVCVGFAFWFCASPVGVAAEKFRLSYAPYAKISAKRAETLRLTRQGKFDAVEALLTPVQQAYERGEVDESAAATAFAPFSTGDETLATPLDQWVAKAPKSFSARLARARYLRARYRLYSNIEGSISPAAIGKARVAEFAKRSIADYQAALAMNPRLMIAYGDLVELAWRTRDSTLLRESYKRALAVSPSTWLARDALLREGAVAREKLAGFLADAAQHESANPLLLQLPSELETDRADQLWDRGNLVDALAMYDEQAKTLDTFGIHKNRARLLRVLGRYPESKLAIDHAIALMPGKYDGYRERGWWWIEQENWTEAAADFRRGLETEPLDPELNWGLGQALEDTPDVAGAIRALELSARWAPAAKTYQRLGSLYLKKAGKPKQALAAYEIAVTLDPNHKWSWYKRGEALDKLNDPRAAESFSRYLALVDPRSPEDQKYIAWAKHKAAGGKTVSKPPANAAR